MTKFLGSISWIGWGLIVLAALTNWQRPTLIRDAFKGNAGDPEPPVQLVEIPPHLGQNGH